MKRIAYMMGVLSTLMLSTAAQGWLQPCPGQYGIQGEYLYLYPCLDDPFYAIDSIPVSTNLSGNGIDNTFGFHSAFRLEGAYATCDCIDLRLRWTYLKGKEHDQVSGNDLFETYTDYTLSVPFDGFADSVNRLTYDTVEALVGRQFSAGCNLSFLAHVGVQYSYIHSTQSIDYFNDTDDFSNQRLSSRMWGVGPELAFSGAYALCNLGNCLCQGNLSIVGRASASLLVSEFKSKISIGGLSDGVDSPTLVENNKNWRVVPNWNIRFGLNYATRAFCCVNTALEIGYEVASFANAIAITRLTDAETAGVSFTQYSDLGLHGPYAALSFSF